MRYPTLILLLAVACFLATPARANLIVGVGDLQLSPGGSGYVDVNVSGDYDLLQACGFEFRITTSGPSRLEFTNFQPVGYLAEPNYVFANDSYAQANPPVGGVSEINVPNDTFTGGDMTLSRSDVTVIASRLLARLQVTAETLAPPEAGDSFSISVQPSSSSFFQNRDGGPLGYTASAGTVTIVPEPCTLWMLAAACGVGLLWVACCRRRGNRVPDTPLLPHY
jgi:hypothetical protein